MSYVSQKLVSNTISNYVYKEWADETPTALNLSELESVLIAKSILFFKLFKLPKTRWAGMHDKLVNVPINDDDLINTLSNVTKLTDCTR